LISKVFDTVIDNNILPKEKYRCWIGDCIVFQLNKEDMDNIVELTSRVKERLEKLIPEIYFAKMEVFTIKKISDEYPNIVKKKLHSTITKIYLKQTLCLKT